MNRPLAEFLGTFFLVLAGTGAIVVNDSTHGSITHVGVAMTFGLVVLVLINTLGDVSGCHINPAVTLAFAAARRFAWRDVPAYLIAQILGAVAASALLRVMFPEHPTLGATLPVGAPWRSLVLEVVLTFFLMLAVLAVSSGSRERGAAAGLTIGALVALEAMFAGPISGASMNPARSIAPALVSGSLEHLWIYVLAPATGALLAILAWRALRPAQPPADSR
jgi:aquaporin Z